VEITMDESLEIKKLDRKNVELLVSKELLKLSEKVALAALDSLGTGKYTNPDLGPWARRIIAVINEHSK
jgi:hypothetical protein